MINDLLYGYYNEDDSEVPNEIKVLKKGKKDNLGTAKKKLCNRAYVMIMIVQRLYDVMLYNVRYLLLADIACEVCTA